MADNEYTFTLSDVSIVEKEPMYQGFFTLEKYQLRHRLFAGGWSDLMERELFARGKAVAVILHDPVLKQVVLVEQFRIGALGDEHSPWLLELVAGMVGPNEDPLEVAIREVHEEAGLKIDSLELVTQYWVSPGGTSERTLIYYGEIDASEAGGIYGLPHEHEDIRVVVLPRAEAFAKVAHGKISSAPAIIGLQWLKLKTSNGENIA